MPFDLTFRELLMMAEGRQELAWDLSNSVMAATINTARSICATILKAQGGKPRPSKPLDFTSLNPYRY